LAQKALACRRAVDIRHIANLSLLPGSRANAARFSFPGAGSIG
jgi:hypothetical protein